MPILCHSNWVVHSCWDAGNSNLPLPPLAAEDLEDRLSIDAPSEEEQDVPSPALAAELAPGEAAAPANPAAEQSKPDTGSGQAAAAADGGAAGPAAAQNTTAGPPDSTAADRGSVAGAEQAQPQPVMLHPGAHQPPVVTESQQQPVPAAPAGEQHIQSHGGHLGKLQSMTPCVAPLQASPFLPEILQAAALSSCRLPLLSQVVAVRQLPPQR